MKNRLRKEEGVVRKIRLTTPPRMEIVKIIVSVILICLLVWGIALMATAAKVNEIENRLKRFENKQYFENADAAMENNKIIYDWKKWRKKEKNE